MEDRTHETGKSRLPQYVTFSGFEITRAKSWAGEETKRAREGYQWAKGETYYAGDGWECSA